MTADQRQTARSQAAATKRARYAQLRGDGMRPADITREMGISDSTTSRYERWYRSGQGLPARPAGWQRPDWKNLTW